MQFVFFVGDIPLPVTQFVGGTRPRVLLIIPFDITLIFPSFLYD